MKKPRRNFCLESLENRHLLTPLIRSFYPTSTTIDPGEPLSLVATAEDATSVEFYLDDGDGTFDTDDELVGVDTREADGWRATVQTDGPYKIMPLGDSITSARSPRRSFRYPLWQRLDEANYNVDFVGTQNEPASSLFDDDHEGHWGWRADQVAAALPNWLQANVPDIVLLHLGTNDLIQEQTVSSTLSEVEQIIFHLRAANPDVVILAAQLIPTRFVSNTLIDQFNAQMPEKVQEWNSDRSPVVLVDMNTPIDAVEDLYDGVHPRESGEQIMADVWFDAIQGVRPLLDPAASFSLGTQHFFAVAKNASGNGETSDPVRTTITVGEAPNVGILGVSATEQLWVTHSTGTAATSENFGAFPGGNDYSHFASGDVNGDGLDDVVARQTNGRLIVGVATGAGGFSFSDWGGWSNTATWSEFQVADFNGDGLADVAARSNSDGTWWVGASNGQRFSNSYWGRYSTAYDWTFVSGDFNGDGRQDIAGRATDGTWWTAISIGSSFEGTYWGKWTTSGTWHDIVVGDFNGDGKDDVAGRLNNTSWNVNQSNGTSFTNRYWGNWTRNVDWMDVSVGDFNGDGRDDIAGRGNGNWWIAVSQVTNRFRHEKWGYWTTRTTWDDVRVLDLNQDGKDDIVGRAANGQWWVFEAQNGRFAGSKGDRWAAGTSWQLIVGGTFGAPNSLSTVDISRRTRI